MRIGPGKTSTTRAAAAAPPSSPSSAAGALLAAGLLSFGCLPSEVAGGAGLSDGVEPGALEPSAAMTSAAVSSDDGGRARPSSQAPARPSQTSGEDPAPAAPAARVEENAEPPRSAPPAGPSDVASGPLGSPPSASTLGYNMDYPGDWTNMPPFIDQMKNARAVTGDCAASDPGCDRSAHLDLDPNGWVRSLRYKDDAERSYASVHFVVNTSSQRPDIGQTFVVTWEGDADVQLHGATELRREPGQRRLSFVLGDGDTLLALRDIDPSDHARNIRIFRADHEALLARGEVFSPDMLAFLEPFGSLRFMDWMQSNAFGQCSGGTQPGRECYAVTQDDCGGGGVCTMPGRWQERPTPDQPSYLAWGQYLDNARPELGTKVGGYALEVMVALANRTGKNPHFNLPAAHDEAYVRHFARYLRAHLAPGLRASVEYSNEVWNWGFPQADYANALGRAMWPNEGNAWVQLAAGRTSEMCRLLKEEFAGEAGRVRCLISPQTDWHELADAVLECPAWRASHPGSGPCYEQADAINITGYFSGCLHQNEDRIAGWLGQGRQAALDLAFEQLEHGGLIEGCSDSLDDSLARYAHFGELARQRGLELYVYESGTHFAYDADDSARQFLVDMTHDERMYDLYRNNFAGFRQAGGGMFNVWGWVARNDAWANADSLLERNHPKYRAIVDFARALAP